jgi:exoribonuclease-2
VHRGDLISVDDGPRHHLGVVIDVQDRRVTVALGVHGKRQVLPLRQIQLIWPLPQTASPPPERLNQGPWHLDAGVVALAPERPDLAAAWQLMVSTPDPQPLDDWFALFSSEPNPQQAAELWLWLKDVQLWFHERQGKVTARPVAELRRLRGQRRRQRLAQVAQDAWYQLLQNRTPYALDTLGQGQQAELQQLLQWASGDTTNVLPDPLQQALRRAGCACEPAAIRHLLVDLGQWDPHQLPAWGHSIWAHGFSPGLEAQAAALLSRAEEPCPGDEIRNDRCGLHCVTIDDEDTQDLDDGLSLEHLEGGGSRIWIHVADPGRLIAAGDPLDLEARRRASSLYLARGIEPMFPWALSCDALSLRAGRRCAAWSIWAELDATGAVATSGVERTWIRPAYRLTYSDADDLIELAPPEEADLARLHALLQLRRSWRLARGALLLDQAEGRVRCRDDQPQLEISDPSAGRLLVAEAMILAGAVVAAFGAAHGLALPYRSQLPSPLPASTALQQLPAGPVRHAALKQGLSRGLTQASPAPHFSLGLEAYVQATSPIRRYGDLLVQRQLAALVTGQAPLDQHGLQQLLADLAEPLRQGNQISRDDQRHWRQVWFAQHRSGQWSAVFLRWLRETDQLGLIWIEALAMELPCHCPAGSQPADALLVRVHRVDPLQDCLQLRAQR